MHLHWEEVYKTESETKWRVSLGRHAWFAEVEEYGGAFTITIRGRQHVYKESAEVSLFLQGVVLSLLTEADTKVFQEGWLEGQSLLLTES